jgi:hypothetical protein
MLDRPAVGWFTGAMAVTVGASNENRPLFVPTIELTDALRGTPNPDPAAELSWHTMEVCAVHALVPQARLPI